LLSAVVYDARSDGCGAEPCDNNLSPGEVVAGGFMTGAVLGAGIGAIAGVEHWERLTIPTYVAVRPSRAGLALVVAVQF
jgi:ribosomal protein S12 methylthiotransferase accessory factor YcaO